MNKGIKLAKGSWLYFLGSDDVLNNTIVLNAIFSTKIPENISLIAGKIIYDGNGKPFIYSKNKNIKTPSWSFSIWLRNCLHHQGTFYKKDVFLKNNYSLKYVILSDYWFNILLFKRKTKCYLLDLVIAKCNPNGVSKSGNWKTYKEEVAIKVNNSSLFFVPLFYTIVFVKIVLRKFVNG